MYGSLRRATEVDLQRGLEWQLELVLVGGDPKVNPVPLRCPSGRHVPRNGAFGLRKVEQVRRGEIDDAVTASLDGRHHVVFADEYGIVVARDCVGRRWTGTI